MSRIIDIKNTGTMLIIFAKLLLQLLQTFFFSVKPVHADDLIIFVST